MFVDPNGELLKQLTRIADAMNERHASAWLDWIKTLASFILGLVTAYLSLLLQSKSTDRKEQSKMRRIVYSELAECFLFLDSTVRYTPTEIKNRGARYQMFQDICSFDGEAYMKANRVVFYQLPEGEILTWMYHWFHKVSAGGTYGLVEIKGPLGFLSEKFQESAELRNNFKKFIPIASFRIIEERIKHYKRSVTIEEMVDSGLLKVVPRTEIRSSPDSNIDKKITSV
jgi:hypothetical protein